MKRNLCYGARYAALVLLLLLTACSGLKIAKDGIAPRELDKYFNPKEQLSVWIYSDFVRNENVDNRLQMIGPSKEDHLILNRLGLEKSKSTWLFSSGTSREPSERYIALKHKRIDMPIGEYQERTFHDAFYYERDFQWDGKLIRHILIPYDKHAGLSFVFLVDSAKQQRCAFCEIDRIAYLNARMYNQDMQNEMTWQISECADAQKIRQELSFTSATYRKKKRLFLRIYEQASSNSLLSYYRIINPKKEKQISVDLCPGKYIFEFKDEHGQIFEQYHKELSEK